MSLTAAATTPPPTTRFALFLVAAVALHGMLLLVPAKRGPYPANVLNRLAVSLRAARKPAPEQVPERLSPEPPQPTEPVKAEAVPERAAPERLPRAAVPPDAPVAEPAPRLSTARLLDDAQRMRWRQPENNGSRGLGEPVPESRSGNTSPASGLAAGPPDSPAAAAPVEVVDRWLAADGSHNVLVRTASGDLLCGRAEAWDPMRPLVEPVMMFRSCGSAGPTFEWPDRYRSAPPRGR